jgi:hypothetical protein
MAEPADGFTFGAIIMLPKVVEQDVDPEVIGYCLERLVEGGSLERWDGLDCGDDFEMRYRLTFRVMEGDAFERRPQIYRPR